MLTTEERYCILSNFRQVCAFNLFPTEVDPESWNVHPAKDKKWKLWSCKVLYVVFIAHALYKALKLVTILLFVSGVPLHQLIIHAVEASAGIMLVFWQYWLHYEHADLNGMYMKRTHNEVYNT